MFKSFKEQIYSTGLVSLRSQSCPTIMNGKNFSTSVSLKNTILNMKTKHKSYLCLIPSVQNVGIYQNFLVQEGSAAGQIIDMVKNHSNHLNTQAVGVRYCLGCRNGLVSPFCLLFLYFLLDRIFLRQTKTKFVVSLNRSEEYGKFQPISAKYFYESFSDKKAKTSSFEIQNSILEILDADWPKSSLR